MVEFTAAVENYDRFMGRYATGLAPTFADAAGVRAGMRMLSHFWRAAREIDPGIADEQPRAGVREGDLVERFGRAGLQGVTGGTLETSVDYADFDDSWEPFTGGAGPATSVFYASLDDAAKATLRDTVRASLPEGPFTLPARAWLALGTVPGATYGVSSSGSVCSRYVLG